MNWLRTSLLCGDVISTPLTTGVTVLQAIYNFHESIFHLFVAKSSAKCDASWQRNDFLIVRRLTEDES